MVALFIILKRDKVYFTQKPIDVLGYHEVDKKGRESIVVNSNLRGAEWLRTALHETVHHLIDYPVTVAVVRLCRTIDVLQKRQDTNAEIFSLIMMFPFSLVERYLLCGDLPAHLELYLEERLHILNYYGV